MGRNRVLCLLFAGCLGAFASAGANFTKYTTLAAPLYFSSTNCRAQMKATGTGLDVIVGWELWVGGEKTESGGLPVGEVGLPEPISGVTGLPKITCSVMFDSSHFATGSTVRVKMRVATAHPVPDGDGGINLINYKFHDSEQYDSCHNYLVHDAPVKNRIAGHTQHGSASTYAGIANAVNNHSPANYDKIVKSGGYWDTSEYFANLTDGCNMSFIEGHGATDVIESGTGQEIHRLTMGESRFEAVGAVPPINPSLVPPLNLLMHYSCCTANGNWKPGLMRYINAYGGYFENQAFVGFTCAVKYNSSYGSAFASKLLERLALGETIGDAVTHIIDLSEAHISPYCYLKPAYLVEGGLEYVAPAELTYDLIVQGDYYAKAKGVYAGLSIPATGLDWFRVI